MIHCCVRCQVEYQPHISTCPECGSRLVSHSKEEAQDLWVRAIYSVGDIIEERHIVAELRRKGIRMREERQQVSQIPSASDTFVIAVHPADAEKALKHLTKMREDGIITSKGVFINLM